MFIDQEHPASVFIVPAAAEGKSHTSSVVNAFFKDIDQVKVYMILYIRHLSKKRVVRMTAVSVSQLFCQLLILNKNLLKHF